MFTREKYSKSPIVEALISIQVAPENEVDQTALLSLRDQLRDTYPVFENLYEKKLHFKIDQSEVSSDTPMKSKMPWIGFRLWNAEKTRVLTIRNDGFTYSLLRPYESWEVLREEADKCWRLYKEQIPNAKITRCAVRYINEFSFPETKNLNPADYFNVHINVPITEETSNVPSFFAQLQTLQKDINGALLINVGTSENKAYTLLLDLDLWSLPGHPPASEAECWEKIDQFHTRQNQMFELIVTDKGKEMIR